MTDLLKNGLGSKSSTEGTGNPSPTQPAKANSSFIGDNTRGKDLLAGAASLKSESAATDMTSVGTEEPNRDLSSKEEPSDIAVKDPDSWTKESALKEMKKARQEAQATRLKYEESVQNLKNEAETRIAQREAELQDLIKAKSELDALKSKEEDKKRDLSEKIAHREALIAEMKAQGEAKDKARLTELEATKAELERYRAESQAQKQVYEQRVQEEMAAIPEKFREVAQLIVKGAGDPRDAMIALNEAKIKGLFEDKTIVVNHSVPGAHDGARSNKDRFDANAKAEREKMTAQQKIGMGLKGIREGTPNTAFRTR